MFRRSGKLFLVTYGIALFGLMLNFTLPASIALAADVGEAGYLLEVCSSSGVKPIQIDGGELASDSNLAQDQTLENHNLCTYCSIHHGGVSVEPGLLSSSSTPYSETAKWFVTPAFDTPQNVLNLSMPPRGPPHA